jgi:N-acylglucosamine 2-epimerase
LEILDCSLEIGWDTRYGGLLYFVDIEGKPPEQLEWDMKLWWPHTEALYATLLAYSLTGDSKYETWFDQIHAWAFSHFADEGNPEWFGYLHRDGTVSNTLKGNLWKGPFHLPRALLLCTQRLNEMLKADETERSMPDEP